MKGLFHSIGKGILYFLTPFAWVVGIAIGSVVALVVFLCYAVYFIFCFFTGRNLFKDLPEDKKAKEILAAQADPAASQPAQPQPQTQIYMNNPQVNLYQNPGYPYPYPPQPGYPYPPQQGPNPYPQQPTVQVTVQPQAEPIAMQQTPQIEVQPEEVTPMEVEEEEPEMVNVPEPEEDESDYEDLSTEEDEDIEEYVPQGGFVSKKDVKDYDND